jgi:2-polyprenyl-6-methoxyphenol hydroxylase-like FAD-dependent oxidoreductase
MIKLDTLIVGAGPTGLMMACQLLRFGVSFKIIDKQAERTNESRAFGIQAKSIEIFDNLGIADEFLKMAIKVDFVNFFINGRHKLQLKFNSKALNGTYFPHIYILPQSETERILIEHLRKNGVEIERNTILEDFKQNDHKVTAQIINLTNNQNEMVGCQYLFGCDGAHSSVRKILNIPFEGGKYKQTFFLADAKIIFPDHIPAGFKLFYNNHGLLLHAPLDNQMTRIIGAGIQGNDQLSQSLNLNSITQFAREISHNPVTIENITWKSLFHLHHRVVSHYQKGRAFLLGDAAHIHSPVGAQGMNTGLQDATNLAWKIALKIKSNGSEKLLETYQLERQLIGKKLTRTTDRIFWLLTTSNYILRKIRPFLIIFSLKLINQFSSIQNRLFMLMSQLAIRYPFNDYTYELTEEADSNFMNGPSAGSRAPDGDIAGMRLFDKLKEKPFNLFIFCSSEAIISPNLIEQLNVTEQKFLQWMGVHKIVLTEQTQLIFHRYGVTQQGLYFIRPDGYIGFRSNQINLQALNLYLNRLFKK